MVSPILLIAIPLFMAFSVPIWGLIWKKLPRFVPFATFATTITILITLIPQVIDKGVISVVIAGIKPPFGINLAFGMLGAFFALIIQIVALVASIYLFEYDAPEPSEKFYMLFILVVLGATGMVLTGDIFNMFVFLEITSISAYALTAIKKDGHSAEAGFKYLLLGSLGSTLFLLGIALIYGSLGTLNMAHIGAAVSQMDPKLLAAAVILILVGMGVEAEMLPMNGWVPDAYQAAPIPVVSLLAGTVAKAGIYALARILYTLIGMGGYVNLLLIFGILTLLAGELSALRQKNVRRLLAYSSIGQMGLIMLALGTFGFTAVTGGIFHALNHAVAKALMFLALGIMAAGLEKWDMDSLEGVGRVKPFTTLLFTIGLLSTIGLPMFAGFWSKLLIIIGMINVKYIAYAVLALTGSVVEVVYFARLLSKLYSSNISEHLKSSLPESKKPFTLIGLVFLAVIVLAIGIYPDAVIKFVAGGAYILLNKAIYISSILGGGIQ